MNFDATHYWRAVADHGRTWGAGDVTLRCLYRRCSRRLAGLTCLLARAVSSWRGCGL